MAPLTTQKNQFSKVERRCCCGWSHQNAAIIVAFLTLANGAVTLVAGIEGFLYGSALVYDQFVVQTATGSTIVFLALALLVILFSRLKVRHSTIAAEL